MRKKLLPGRPAKKSWNSATITLLLGNRTSVFGATWLIAGLTARLAQGAFIVECRSDGWGYANFSYPGSTAPSASTKSTADRKSTRLNSSHANISYAVFCLKKKKHK